ncbi:hypothetical protein HO173_001119 [Letharia columbiana]|uniref:Uncharacterized protein n=1 Tax=Letharia columbiana TaxID=112416 RepID=A0A8H6G4M9_9LECA|nr:uncharacterized protein HO173_001119 [Letharia columbiana]KAF6240451.1 hypothetical protein HO173_001119 [Letharia columbiana]
MKLLGHLLSLCGSFSSSREPGSAASNHAIISVHDIVTVHGLASVPSPYHHLSFSSYSVLTPRDPALDGLISEHDLNCAVSSPNALIGSRPMENADGAYFDIANATSMAEEGLQPYFTLKSFYIKPMDAPAPGTKVSVKGYTKVRDEPYVWQVDFPSGFHLPFLVKMEEYSGEEWKEIYKVEIVADFGYDDLDWEFCVDDIELRFFALPEDESESLSHSGSQIISGKGAQR